MSERSTLGFLLYNFLEPERVDFRQFCMFQMLESQKLLTSSPIVSLIDEVQVVGDLGVSCKLSQMSSLTGDVLSILLRVCKLLYHVLHRC